MKKLPVIIGIRPLQEHANELRENDQRDAAGEAEPGAKAERPIDAEIGVMFDEQVGKNGRCKNDGKQNPELFDRACPYEPMNLLTLFHRLLSDHRFRKLKRNIGGTEQNDRARRSHREHKYPDVKHQN
jgi:hypothetical protein